MQKQLLLQHFDESLSLVEWQGKEIEKDITENIEQQDNTIIEVLDTELSPSIQIANVEDDVELSTSIKNVEDDVEEKEKEQVDEDKESSFSINNTEDEDNESSISMTS